MKEAKHMCETKVVEGTIELIESYLHDNSTGEIELDDLS